MDIKIQKSPHCHLNELYLKVPSSLHWCINGYMWNIAKFTHRKLNKIAIETSYLLRHVVLGLRHSIINHYVQNSIVYRLCVQNSMLLCYVHVCPYVRNTAVTKLQCYDIALAQNH